MGLRELVASRLRDTRPGGDPLAALAADLSSSQLEELRRLLPNPLMPAAVMVPLVDRPQGMTVLLTQRASHLKAHPGQISFPGGRVEEHDAGPWEAALREAREEIGLNADYVSLAGYLADHVVLTGFRITPAVAIVQPGFDLVPDLTEVDEVFEVPLSFILDPASRVARERVYSGHTFRTWDLPWCGRHIWGATAAMLINLADRLREA